MADKSKSKAKGAASKESPVNVKLLLIGNSSVGKSSILLRYSDEQWLPEDEASATIGVDFRVHKMDVNGRKVKLSIWDTAGQERFRTITSSYYRGAQGIILVYDISNRETFDGLSRWFSELEMYVPNEVVKIVVGNKVDKEFSRQVSTTEGRAFAERMSGSSALFIETSAKTSLGVQEAFEEVVNRILDSPSLWAPVNAVGGDLRGNGSSTIPGGTIELERASTTHAQAGGCSC